MMPCCRQTADGVVIEVYVQPRASRNQVTGLQGEALKVRLTSPPVEGAANRLCTEFLARLLGVPRSAVELIAGDKSRHKRLLVRGARLESITAALAPYLPPFS